MRPESFVIFQDLDALDTRENGEERKACVGLDPKGFFIRHPPAPNLLQTFITPDEDLFRQFIWEPPLPIPTNM